MSLFRRNKGAAASLASQQDNQDDGSRQSRQQEADNDDVPPEVLRASQIQATPDLIEGETMRLLECIIWERAERVGCQSRAWYKTIPLSLYKAVYVCSLAASLTGGLDIINDSH